MFVSLLVGIVQFAFNFNKLIQQMSESQRISPDLSVLNEKNEVKKQREQMEAMRNRVDLLRQQLQKEKDQIKKNKHLTKQAIQKKVEVSKMSQWKNKDNSEQIDRINQLRRRNQQARLSHQKQIQDIQKAIYLVKLDDARELKHQSQQHSQRIKDMQRQFLSGQQRKKKKVAEESQQAKEKYVQYWKQKLANIYTEQAQTIVKLGKQKETNKKELSKLEEEEIKLMEEINRYHTQGVQSKKEYLAALSLPVKDVAEAMGSNVNQSMVSKNRRSMTINHSQLSNYQSSGNQSKRYSKHEVLPPKMPSTHVNEGKLKMVLQQLKKVERSGMHTSR